MGKRNPGAPSHRRRRARGNRRKHANREWRRGMASQGVYSELALLRAEQLKQLRKSPRRTQPLLAQQCVAGRRRGVNFGYFLAYCLWASSGR